MALCHQQWDNPSLFDLAVSLWLFLTANGAEKTRSDSGF